MANGIQTYWEELLTPKGLKHMTINRWEILSIYYKIGVHWHTNLLSTLFVGDKFTIPKTKDGIIPGCTYQVMSTGIIKCNETKDEEEDEEDEVNIQLSQKYTSGILFKFKGISFFV